jgi:UDP-N-acetylmuramate: L-alanyl-gamma-D-glutamyl-meso-diaminopimelate ligase
VKNSQTKDPVRIHLIAVGGTGMAPLACLLQGRGHRVTGSDNPLYPPMSTLLERAGIRPLVGFDPAHLEPPPDLVIVGNAVPRDNPEAVAAERLHQAGRLERISMPEALWRFFLADRHRVVVAGTHGKTTTTSMSAWVWTACGADPGYLVGGVPKDLPDSFREGGGADFIVEGDEYNAAYFDRGPKFLHYRPDTLILTSAEHDHADLYPTHRALLDAYGALIGGMGEDALLVACADAPEVLELARGTRCRVVTYGLGMEGGPDVTVEGGAAGVDAGIDAGGGTRVTLLDRSAAGGPAAGRALQRHELRLAVPGRHNLSNALAVWAAAHHRGLAARAVAEALSRFHGVARRLEELGTAAGVTVIDDFAHHPTAVGESLAALVRRYPGRRLVALFEPRSLTAGRAFLRDAYSRAFRDAGRVFFAPLYYAERLGPEERIDFADLARELSGAGVPAEACPSIDRLCARALEEAVESDVLVTMSSGSFGGLPHRLLEALRAR